MSRRKPDPEARWSVRVIYGIPRLLIDGKYWQEFDIGNSVGRGQWCAKMLRLAMRRLAPDKERKGKP